MRLTVSTFLSLDGVMQSPGLREEDADGFAQGGWQVPYLDADTGNLMREWFTAADAFLFGRQTYEIFVGHWPHVTDPDDLVATKLNRLPKYVASTTLDTVEWNNSILIKGDLAGEVAALKRQPGDELQVHGSGRLIRSLMAYDLVDEYRLWIYPVVLGSGKRLFADGLVPTALRRVDTRTLSSGAVVHAYQPAGAPEYGSVADATARSLRYGSVVEATP
jgi:dihydrofolate reductase